MIIKILGILDIISGFSFWLFGLFAILPKSFLTIIAFYLLIKAVFFLYSRDIASILDIICSIIIFTSFNIIMPKFIVIIVAFFLIQKGIFSLLS